ncbi:MAG: translation elongation factor 4 [Candidatus Calescibacterium sp.]|nr:translation elongation factor 4 [Candidatus Calescibacterium sp.]MCX7733809.1 translation elongation factor 4 [bacterium]MDW8086985.1 translation elongation factor 4 [Candidatus Calescibacterium sp.]
MGILFKENKRNFCIIAHVDHGKSTLSDRILEITGAVDRKKLQEQFLDNLPVERERGITVRSQTAYAQYTYDGQTYNLNLIDTPGHADFHYEVSRAMTACEGAVLLVDATQGVQAQTLSYSKLALERGLEIIVAINKIDLPFADPEGTKTQIEEILGIKSDPIFVSGKTGFGVPELLNKIIERIPPPMYEEGAPTSALIFDSWYDNYWGVIALIRIFNGKIKKGDKVKIFSSGKNYVVHRLGFVIGGITMERDVLEEGDVGFIILGTKDISEVRVGDTITSAQNPAHAPIPGFREIKPVVFASFYPVDPDEYEKLKESLMKLKLNDYSISVEYESSPALGAGFRIGFSGTLHMEIVSQRLKDEFNVDVVMTFPQVAYRVVKIDGQEIEVKSPAEFPSPEKIESIKEPYALVTIHTKPEFVGDIFKVCEERRGRQIDFRISSGIAVIKYLMPIAEIIFGFNDEIKSVSKGYASWDYEFHSWEESDVVKLETYINYKKVDELSTITVREKAQRRSREIAMKLRELIPRQIFEVVIQVGVGSKIFARESVKPYRKDVTAKCYGGDVTRKMKLLEKQKEGKKRLKMIGNVEIPPNAFVEVFRVDRSSKRQD